MESILGLWKEYGWRRNSTSVHDTIVDYVEGVYDCPKAVIDYLEGGMPMVGMRTGISCVFTQADIGVPIAFTDGEFIWTGEYIYYLSLGVIPVHKDLLEFIESMNYRMKDKEEIGIARIRELGALI